MRAKSFFYVSVGILALATAYHLGASTATAQAPGNSAVAFVNGVGTTYGGTQVVLTANGDVYASSTGSSTNWTLISNVFTGPPTPTTQSSWGALKVKSR